MKKQIVVLAALVAVLVCLSVAVVVNDNRKPKTKPVDPQVAALRTELSRAQITMIEHDSVNEANIKNSADRILGLQQTNATLCSQIKAARLAQPLCK